MTSLSDAIEKHLASTAEKDRQARQERQEQAQERAVARDAREARWQALDDQERLRLSFLAHKRGMSPLELMDTPDTNEENRNA